MLGVIHSLQKISPNQLTVSDCSRSHRTQRATDRRFPLVKEDANLGQTDNRNQFGIAKFGWVRNTSTDGGSNTHTISLNPSSGISSTSTAAISHSAGTTLTQTAGSSITHNAPTVNIPQVLKVAGSLAVPGLGSFASNAAAAAGGVPAGSVFVSSITNALMVRV